MTDEQITYVPSSSRAVLELKKQKMTLESGALGKLFGGRRTAPGNICGFVLTTLVLVGALRLIWPDPLEPKSVWEIIGPFVALALGYLFGRGGKDA